MRGRKCAERVRVGRGPAGFGIARVQVQDRRARLAAATLSRTISSGVTGRCGDIDGVWIDPVTAHVSRIFAIVQAGAMRCAASSPANCASERSSVSAISSRCATPTIIGGQTMM